MGKKAKQQTVTNNPFKPAQDDLTQILDQAQQLQEQGQLAQPGFGGTSSLANQLIQKRALLGNPLLQEGQQRGRELLNAQNPAAGIAGQLAQGQFGQQGLPGGRLGGGTQLSNTGAPGAGPVDTALGTLSQTAQGDFVGANPFLNQTFDRAADAVQDRIASQFGQSGRFGGAQQQLLTGRTLNDLSNQIFGGAFQQERQNQLGAAGTLGQLGLGQGQLGLNTELGRGGLQLGGAQLQGSLGAQDLQRQLGAVGLAPGLAGSDFNDLNQLAQLGLREDDVARLQSPFQQLQNRLGIVQPIANAGGSTSQPLFRNSLAGGLGGALSGSQIGSSIAGGLSGGLTGAQGGALGAGIGGVAGLLQLSQ